LKEPTLLLQSGPYMQTEKIACAFSDYPSLHCSYENIAKLDAEEAKIKMVPIGTVEFVSRYCDHVGIALPRDFSYSFNPNKKWLMRSVRKGLFKDAGNHEFVKPLATKLFTGDIKENLQESVDPETEVWISEPVEFGSEFRFYIHDTITSPKILGWSRYDSLMTLDPEPDFDLVETIAQDLHDNLGPLGYSIDIGWNKTSGKYCLVEMNDGWSLGYYENVDPQSNPPTRQQYADLVVSRWSQIVFCHLI
jgi:hypothetical protein